MILKQCLLLLACSALAIVVDASLHLENRALETKLFDEVSAGNYDAAIATTRTMKSQKKSAIVRDAVKSLMYDKIANSMEYAYKLWNSGEQNIVKDYFPVAFRSILGGVKVKILDYQFFKALKLGYEADNANDRTAYGDSKDQTSKRVAWKFIPVWENDRVYFKILNLEHNQYLKLGTAADNAGDHTVYAGDSAEGDRYLWYLQPILFNYKPQFYIFNKQYNKALKLGSAEDWAGDHTAYGHNGEVLNDPDMYSWSIRPF